MATNNAHDNLKKQEYSTATVLRMTGAISRKNGGFSRVRWPYLRRTTTAKEALRHLKFVVNCALVFSSIGAFAQELHDCPCRSQDIVPICAKVKYSTLIEPPPREDQGTAG